MGVHCAVSKVALRFLFALGFGHQKQLFGLEASTVFACYEMATFGKDGWMCLSLYFFAVSFGYLAPLVSSDRARSYEVMI